jgi:hypothetical protein
VRLVAPRAPQHPPDDTLRRIAALGGGVGISGYAAYRMATEDRVFAMPDGCPRRLTHSICLVRNPAIKFSFINKNWSVIEQEIAVGW